MARAEIVSKVIKFPGIEDYKNAIRELVSNERRIADESLIIFFAKDDKTYIKVRFLDDFLFSKAKDVIDSDGCCRFEITLSAAFRHSEVTYFFVWLLFLKPCKSKNLTTLLEAPASADTTESVKKMYF